VDINAAFPSNYIKASDLQGGDRNVVIRAVEVEGVGRDKDQKPVLYFQGKEKGLVLNKTNANAISKLYGSDTANWLGKAIVIYPTETEFGGETVECIRVRLKQGNGVTHQQMNGGAPQQRQQPQPSAAYAGPTHEPLGEDDIPF
jgi:hypothetical protein